MTLKLGKKKDSARNLPSPSPRPPHFPYNSFSSPSNPSAENTAALPLTHSPTYLNATSIAGALHFAIL